MNDERLMSDTEEQNRAAFDPVATDALIKRLLACDADDLHELKKIDPESAADALSPEDREALSRLPSPEQLILERLAAKKAFVGSGSTRCFNAAGEETVAMPGERLPDMDELNDKEQAVFDAQEMIWTSGYRKVRELGRGGQGVVYLIESIDELSRTTQALKVYSPRPYPNAEAYRKDMKRIASVVNQIHHDNVIDVQQFFERDGIYVMVMQLIDGFDIRRLMDPELLPRLEATVSADRWRDLDKIIYSKPSSNRVGLQPLQAANIIEKCLRGLGALHEKGIVHGDIKPSNIMLDCNGSIRLVDVGSAYAYRSPPQRRIWTPRYAPPEFLLHEEWTPQSDLASLGYVLLELLSGDVNLGGPVISDDSTTQRDPRLNRVLLEAKNCLPQRLEHLLPENVRACNRLMGLCRKLIDPDPSRRFASAAEAMASDDCGTWRFRVDIIKGNLGVHEATAIKHWLEDVKQVA